ncbi:toxin glutamine deamidase domain-containing protein [Streptomyces tremellae]|uniref:toxin glutamine deamidase domain-containing protein n=1 Tax=Streptomyces tremellae TaxID=1124239 RepID=UPI0031EF92D8
MLGLSRPEAFVHEAELDRPSPDTAPPEETGAAERTGERDEAAPQDDAPVVAEARPRPRPTLLDEFTEKVLAAAAAKHPDMIAPLADFANPADPRWHGRDHYRTALQNTLDVVNTLSHHSMAGNLEALVTTGVRVDLVGPGRFQRAHRYLWIDGALTDRRYEGTQNDLHVRTSSPATQRMDGSRNVVRGYDGGLEGSLQVRAAQHDLVGRPNNSGTLQVGPRWGRQTGHRTGYGSTASVEALSSSTSPSHLHSYRIELSASMGGYRRFRHLWRGTASLGVLAAQMFVRDEPRTDLVGGTAGDAVAGRVLLAVASEHALSPGAYRAFGTGRHTPAFTERRLTAAEARALATGDPRNAPPAEAAPFGSHPFSTVGVGAHRELVSGVEQVMRETSGGSWFFKQVGAPAHSMMVRPLQPHALTADYDLLSAAAGNPTNGLFGQGPYLNRLGALVHRAVVGNVTAASEPMRIETERSLSSDTQASGAVTTTHTFTLALAGNASHSHPVGGSVSGTYGLAGAFGRENTVTRSVNRTISADVTSVETSHQILVVGDTTHDIAGTVRGDGLLAPLHALATRARSLWVGRRLTFGSDWVGHVSEKTAHRIGLLRDRLGDVPLYRAKQWRQPRWLRESPFGSYPVNSLDAGDVVAEFERKIKSLGADDASRDLVRSLNTPRALRALRDRLASGGTESRLRVGGPGVGTVRIGGRTLQLRAELLPGEAEFDGLHHGTLLAESRGATETSEVTRARTTTRALGVQVAETPGTGARVVPAAGPTYGEQGSSSRQTAAGNATVRSRNSVFYANEPHAEYLTGYRLRLTLDLGDGRTVRSEGPVGEIRDQVPLSLSTPVADGTSTAGHTEETGRETTADVLDAPVPVEQRAGVTLWRPQDVTPENIDRWRAAAPADGEGEPFAFPPTGFHVSQVTGAANLRAAGDLAVAKAYGTSLGSAVRGGGHLEGETLERALAKAHDSGLTRPGTASALALHDGQAPVSLAAFFSDAVEEDGYQVAGLSEDTFAGGAEGAYRLYARPDLGAARLIAVAPAAGMETDSRTSASTEASVVRGGGQQNTVGGGPVAIVSDAAGAAQPVLQSLDTTTTAGDSRRLGALDTGQVTVKAAEGRAFLFAVPTKWLGVADVHRTFKDGAVGSWMSRNLGPFGPVKPGPQAVESDTHVLAWVREDVARELGLVDDTTFPEHVAAAWDGVKRAGEAWAAADTAYWEVRHELQDLRQDHAQARRELTVAKATLGRAHAEGDVAGERAAREQVRARAARVRDVARVMRERWEALGTGRAAAERAAADFHGVRLAADRLTRWHRLPEEQRAGIPEPAHVAYEAAPEHTAPQDRPRYTVEPGADGLPPRLTAPDGTTYTVRDVPRDGDGFYRSLALGLGHADPARLAGSVPADEAEHAGTALRALLADRLTDPDHADLLAFVSPDTDDTFTRAEAAGAGLRFARTSRQGAEFAATHRMPLHEVLSEDERTALAVAQLRRPGTVPASGEHAPGTADGWDHGAADILPALAARVFGARVTVVRDDGTYEDFAPQATDHATLPHVVLHLAGRHYTAALPEAAAEHAPAGHARVEDAPTEHARVEDASVREAQVRGEDVPVPAGDASVREAPVPAGDAGGRDAVRDDAAQDAAEALHERSLDAGQQDAAAGRDADVTAHAVVDGSAAQGAQATAHGATRQAHEGEEHAPAASRPAPVPPGQDAWTQRLATRATEFAVGSVRLPDSLRTDVDTLAGTLARTALTMRAKGHPHLPAVTVTGYDTGTGGGGGQPHFGEALRVGQERAGGVVAAFRDALGAHLDRLRAGGNEHPLTADDFAVTARSAGFETPPGAQHPWQGTVLTIDVRRPDRPVAPADATGHRSDDVRGTAQPAAGVKRPREEGEGDSGSAVAHRPEDQDGAPAQDSERADGDVRAAKRPRGAVRDSDEVLRERGLVPPTAGERAALDAVVAQTPRDAEGRLTVTPGLLRAVNPSADLVNCLESNLALWDTLDGRPRVAGASERPEPESRAVWRLEERHGAALRHGTGQEGLDSVAALVRAQGPGSRALVLTAEEGVVGHAVSLLHTSGGIVVADLQRGTVSPLAPGVPPVAPGARVWAHAQDPSGVPVLGAGHYDDGLYRSTDPAGTAPEFGAPAVTSVPRPFARSPFVDTPGWQAAATAFEQDLAAHAYADPQVKRAVSEGLRRLSEVLVQHSGAEPQEVRRSFLRDEASYAGQVGTALSPDEVDDLLENGSTREMFTAFYNAAYDNEEAEFSLRKVLTHLLGAQDWDRVRALGLDEESLRAYHSSLTTGRFRFGAQGATSLLSPGHAHLFRAGDPFALGNLISHNDSWLTDGKELLASRATRVWHDEDAKSGLRRTPGFYRGRGAGLSERESAYLLGKERLTVVDGEAKAAGTGRTEVLSLRESDLRDGESGPEFPVMWEEGHTRFTVDTSAWAAGLRARGIKTLTGVSGTAALMLSAFRWLNTGIDPALFLKGLIGWMGVHDDHSLYEMLRGAQMAGLRTRDGAPLELSDGAAMYRSLASLGLGFERHRLRSVSPAGQLPHETVYRDLVRRGRADGGLGAPTAAHREKADALHQRLVQMARGSALASSRDPWDPRMWLARNKLTARELVERVSPAHLYALRAFTGEDFVPINTVLKAVRFAGGHGVLPDPTPAALRTVFRRAVDSRLEPQASPTHSAMLFADQRMAELLAAHVRDLGNLIGPPQIKQLTARSRAAMYARVDELLPSLVTETRIHAEMVVDALSALPPVRDVTVWRGNWAMGGDGVASPFLKLLSTGYNADVITFNDLSSATLLRDKALEFVGHHKVTGTSHPVLLRLRLKGGHGRDISAFSHYPHEAEVAFLPGARFRVTNRVWTTERLWGRQAQEIAYEMIEAEEIDPSER